MYQLKQFEKHLKTLTHKNEFYYLLFRNSEYVFEFLNKLLDSIHNDIDSQMDSINNINIQNLVLAIILISLSFGLIIPGFITLKQRSQRIC